MPNLLVIETSPRGHHSVSRNMSQRFVDAWRARHADGSVTERDLAETKLPFVDAPWLHAYFTPVDQQSAEMRERLRTSDELVAEVFAADHLMISTPVYNFNVPAALKAWIDQIVRTGLTLGFDGKGKLAGKVATVLIASGGVYTEGSPWRDRNFTPQYLRVVLETIGITDIAVVHGGNTKVVGMGEQTVEAFIDALAPEIRAAASR